MPSTSVVTVSDVPARLSPRMSSVKQRTTQVKPRSKYHSRSKPARSEWTQAASWA